MCIPSIRCDLPFCGSTEEEQTSCSLYIRIAAIAFGGIMLLVGILALNGMSGLQVLGTPGGATLTVMGGLILFAGLCLRSVKAAEVEGNTKQITQDKTAFVDPIVRGSGGSTTDHTGKTTTHSESYCSLEKFLASAKPNDIAVRGRLTKDLGVVDLSQRMEENFANKKIGLALPLNFKNEIRDDELLFQILKLTYLPANDLLTLPLEDIKTYDEEKRNILCLRLMQIDAIPCAPGTLGAFLSLREEILSDEIPPVLYAFFTKEQVIYFLQEAKNIDQKLFAALFPSSRHFFATRSASILSELPIEHVNVVLPFVSGELLWNLIRARGGELDYDLISKDQVDEMLPTCFMEKDKSAGKMEGLPIEILNGLLPKMHYSLSLVPDKHLKDRRLNLTPLSKNQVSYMFPNSLMEKDKSQERMGRLHIDVLNQILPNMDYGQLQLVPNNHLSNSQLNLRVLSQDKIRDMLPTNFMEKDKSKRRVDALHSNNRNYVNTIVKFDRF